MENKIRSTDIEFILKNTIKNINELFSKDLKLKDFLAFSSRIRPQLSLLNLRYLYYKQNSINEELENNEKVSFSEIKTFQQWRNLNAFVKPNGKYLYIFSPLLNKESNEISFSVIPVFDVSSTNHIKKPLKKYDKETFNKRILDLWNGWNIMWVTSNEIKDHKLILNKLDRTIFINEKYQNGDENYLLIHEFCHELANHEVADRKDLLKEFIVVKACEMCYSALNFESMEKCPRYENYEVLEVLKQLSNKQKYKLLDDILDLGYKLINYLEIKETNDEK
ncbi:hypothetical protein BCF89_1183 [Metamycoplasma auris]|uniref:Uncharacterized protein n=2 Tax=Metamycoplasma auris TaxID=51363 RepID=A0A2W7G0F1_9BACT|nr:hypothetical protein BCF89_1183 [Metamycoplasma auris]